MRKKNLNKDPNKKLISFGGGVNSTAMIIYLLKKGMNYPIVFCDTGSEQPETYYFLEYFEEYLKRKWDKEIVKITPLKEKELYSKRIRESETDSIEDFCLKLGIVPFVCFRWCTSEFKRDPVHKWGKKNGIYNNLIGISFEESHRANAKIKNSVKSLFPLVDDRIDRNMCKLIIKEEGLEIPKKSGCFFCPYQKINDWRSLYKRHNDLYKRVIKMEENACIKQNRRITMRADDISVKDLMKSFNQENPLFKDVADYSDRSCFMCNI